FYPVDFINRREIEGIRGQPVQRVRGNPDDTPARKEMRRIAQHIRLGALWVDAQQFSWQFFGLWRRRSAIPQRSDRAALIWARYHTPPSGAITACGSSSCRCGALRSCKHLASSSDEGKPPYLPSCSSKFD